MDTNKVLLFIVGTGRSGTSLLQSMLASHSEIAYLPETLFFRRFVVNNGKGTTLESWIADQRHEEIASYLKSDRYFERTDMDPNKLMAHINKDFPNSTIALYRALLNEKGRIDNCRIVGDKDPKSVEFLPVIHSYDPSAIVIQMVRDPRDVLVSRKKAEWSKNHSLIKHLFAIRIQSKLAYKYYSQIADQKYIRVKYEELISTPEFDLNNICKALNINFESNMLQFWRAAERLISKEEYSWKKETTGDLMVNNFDKWPGILSKFEIAMTEAICHEVFLKEGYEISDAQSELTRTELFRIRIYRMIANVADPVYILSNWIINRNAVNRIQQQGN